MGYVPHFCPILTQNPLDHEAFQILPHSFRWANIGYLNALQHGVRSPLMGGCTPVPCIPDLSTLARTYARVCVRARARLYLLGELVRWIRP